MPYFPSPVGKKSQATRLLHSRADVLITRPPSVSGDKACLSLHRFYAALALSLKNRYKIVHAAAAEVVGMAMKQKAEVDKVHDTLKLLLILIL